MDLRSPTDGAVAPDASAQIGASFNERPSRLKHVGPLLVIFATIIGLGVLATLATLLVAAFTGGLF